STASISRLCTSSYSIITSREHRRRCVFSSRRRHTRSTRDWSSDVCSSDLKANQYDNLSNTAAHYEQTGPEIWDQTDGTVTHLVVGVGTGGTVSGVARYLKEQNPAIKIWGIDTYGSVFKKYKETGIFDKHEI